MSNYSSIICWKRYCFWIEVLWTFVRTKLGISMWAYLLVLDSLPFICMSATLSTSHNLNYWSYIMSWFRYIEASNFILLKIISLILVPLHFHKNFRIISSISIKTYFCNFDRNYIKPVYQLGKTWHIYYIVLLC